MIWLWVGLAILAAAVVAAPLALHLYVVRAYLPWVDRIFQERPLFLVPRGQPAPGAEEVTLTTDDGVRLCGCYLPAEARPRKGVILFGLEFGSNRWGCLSYCESLRAAGYDVFAFEMRGQGDSPAQPGYEPLQWVTDFELRDFAAALAYLKGRPDRDPRGVGLFGLSKGGSAGLMAAAADPFVRCCVTDGVFGTRTTMLPYIRQWAVIYIRIKWVTRLLPLWYLVLVRELTIRRVARLRHCHYPDLEAALPKLAPRPLLMIHGGADTYIKPEMARALFELAGAPKELWLVEGAKHNQAVHVANGEYKRRVRAFFDTHLAAPAPPSAAPAAPAASAASAANGIVAKETPVPVHGTTPS